MKAIGRDQLRMYNASHFLRQPPDPSGLWQDSTWLHWWDLDNDVGGVHRIGHEYNIEGSEPMIALWSNLLTPKGMYKHVLYHPLREQDKLPNGWGGGDETTRNEIVDGIHIWTVDDPEAGVSATLNFEDFHESFMGFPMSGRTNEDIAPNHIDTGGRLTGTINMQGTQFEATNGMGVRDHGWGHRNLATMHSHRYVAGTFGPDFTFCAWAIHNGVNDSIEAFGWVVKDTDTVVFAKDIDIVTYAEIDSASTRGGHITMQLADGDVLDCELTAVAPGVYNHFHIANNNTLCRASCNGRDGAGMFESWMNYHQGTRPPGKLQSALWENGFHPAPFASGETGALMAKRTL